MLFLEKIKECFSRVYKSVMFILISLLVPFEYIYNVNSTVKSKVYWILYAICAVVLFNVMFIK